MSESVCSGGSKNLDARCVCLRSNVSQAFKGLMLCIFKYLLWREQVSVCGVYSSLFLECNKGGLMVDYRTLEYSLVLESFTFCST